MKKQNVNRDIVSSCRRVWDILVKKIYQQVLFIPAEVPFIPGLLTRQHIPSIITLKNVQYPGKRKVPFMKNLQQLLFLFMFIMYGAAFFTGCSSGSSSNNEILESLGVKTDLGKRTGPDKREVRDDYNPLNSDVTQIIRRCEIFAAGIAGEVDTVNNLAAWGAAEYHAALDCEFDSNAGTWTFTETQSSDSDTGWDKLPKSMAAGDVDGDGKDEVFIAYYNNSNSSLYFRVIGNTGGAYATTVNGTIATSVSVSEYPDHYWWLNNFNVAAGDADGLCHRGHGDGQGAGRPAARRRAACRDAGHGPRAARRAGCGREGGRHHRRIAAGTALRLPA